MTRDAANLTHLFIAEGVCKMLKELDDLLGTAMRHHDLHNSDESRRILLRAFSKLEETGHIIMEIMVEETMHEQIALYQKTMRLLPRAKYAALMNMKHRTAEEETMLEALSPV